MNDNQIWIPRLGSLVVLLRGFKAVSNINPEAPIKEVSSGTVCVVVGRTLLRGQRVMRFELEPQPPLNGYSFFVSEPDDVDEEWPICRVP